MPAKVAGVERIVVRDTAHQGRHASTRCMLAACTARPASTEIYTVGGAQAVAALAYGTETIRPGRQDHRPGQRLRGRCQEDRLGRRGNRYDRRPLRGLRRGRRDGRSRHGGHRPHGPGRARPAGKPAIWSPSTSGLRRRGRGGHRGSHGSAFHARRDHHAPRSTIEGTIVVACRLHGCRPSRR